MSYQGFGKASGPSGGLKQQPSFGNFHRPPSASPLTPPFPNAPASQTSSGVEVLGRVQSPHLAFQNTGPAPSFHHQSSGFQRSPEAAGIKTFPPFGIESIRPVASHSQPAGVYRPILSSPPRLVNEQLFGTFDAQIHQKRSIRPSFVASHSSETSSRAEVNQVQIKRTRSPPLLSGGEENSRNSGQGVLRGIHPIHPVDKRSELGHLRTRTPPLGYEYDHSLQGFYPRSETQRSALASPISDNILRQPGNYAKSQYHQEQPLVSLPVESYDSGRSFRMESTDFDDIKTQKRSRPAVLPSTTRIPHEDSLLTLNNSKKPSVSVSPPRRGPKSDGISHDPDSRLHQWSLLSENNTSAEVAPIKSTSFSASKRTRSPPLPSSDQVFQGTIYTTEDSTEREMLAKAKRLARFKVELSKNEENSTRDENVALNKHEKATVERPKYMSNRPIEFSGDVSNGNSLSDYEGHESSSIIIGLCPDMCPESERAERERKGDLDQYERLDGDRNQTNKFLAVKKYTRTAEREANLIRPMPILQKTIDYLLNLLDEPYGESFLGMYNFLWDRMRAIRMDLRMQHIFNNDSITMLEQMIRLHIIAMHELCEYSKGEGFSEGFDAHLNIEQMNKTSVELFQMYDDHRKKGINVTTEKEFRGYYALLKLDKHPGYKVEPAELSLDLAKMTPEMRQTPEVLFARDVARGCRTGNFIAFFRLTRKASYLQACLMHAHFAKLRTQALASLHSGLQNNQGLPVSHAAKWLGMEEEDIEGLLQYHGFLIKVFEESYMVKEGPFLNSDKDYPTKCSKLVHMKKSRRIVKDVSPPDQIKTLLAEATKPTQLARITKEPQRVLSFEKKNSLRTFSSVEKESSAPLIDEEMPEDEASQPEDDKQVQPIIKPSVLGQLREDFNQVARPSHASWSFPSFEPQPTEVGNVGRPNYVCPFMNSVVRDTPSRMEASFPIVSKADPEERSPVVKKSYAVNPLPQSSVINILEDEELPLTDQGSKHDDNVAHHEEEAAEAKLKLILRLWRRRSLKRRQLREQRLLAANAALNSLSLGPLIHLNKDQPITFDLFDIDYVTRERHKRHALSWSSLNVSDVVVGTLRRRYSEPKCLCWKVVVCSQMSNPEGDDLGQRSHVSHMSAGSWLLSKLMPSNKSDDNLIFSSSGLSIWKKWVSSQSDTNMTCCLSIIKDTKFDNLYETVAGASAVLYVISESIPWDLQKAKLHKLVMSIRTGSCLPLLILSGSFNEEVSDPFPMLVSKLCLNDLDKSRISNFLVVPLVAKQQVKHFDGFFSDTELREGLQWLAKESPLQPVPHRVKSLGLILNHLNLSLERLSCMKDYNISPNNCISAFNDALDQSIDEISDAAEANPTNWPCPEIALLEESSDENRMLTQWLPSIGWSLAENVEPLKHALLDLKLPNFPDDKSWISQNSKMCEELEIQRAKLETSLTRYLSQSSKMMGHALASKEAYIMLQRYAQLQLQNFCYSIVPKWVMIFRRIFNWRLMSLASGAFSSVYILDCCHVTCSVSGEHGEVSVYHLNQPSLDETIEVGCSPLLFDVGQRQLKVHQPVAKGVPNGRVRNISNTTHFVEDERNLTEENNVISCEDVPFCISGELEENTSREIVIAGRVNIEGEKLSKLLEQCNILQNTLDEKLSFYF